MTLDVLDAAFVRRWETTPRTNLPTDCDPPRADASWGDDVAAAETDTPVHPAAAVHPAVADPFMADDADDRCDATAGGIVPRLLAAARPQWESLAGRLEDARLRGRRVIAVAGGTAGEGRSTLVDCLVAVLRSRGRDVLRLGPTDVAARTGTGPTHDKRIMLVDAGIWFPPGPIRRPRLFAVSQGCDAAILVRRAGATATASWEAALAAIGIEVLGEVLTFVPAAEEASPSRGSP